jgi:hypothetical protein
MNTKAILHLFGFFFVLAACLAVENPNVGTSRSAPASSGQRQRFISTPNTYGGSGNDVISGNVGGMKYFHGVIPYGSSYYSGAYAGDSGSRTVNNFLRRSADPLANDRNPGQPRSYYDPARTVSSYQRPDGTSGLSMPIQTGQGRNNPYVTLPVDPLRNPQYQRRPLSDNDMDLEQLFAKREQLQQKANDLTDQEKTERKNFFDLSLVPEEKEKQNNEKTEEETESAIKPRKDRLTDLQEQFAQTLNEQEKDQQTVSDQTEADKESPQPDEQKPTDYASPESDLVPKFDPEMLDRAEGKKILGEHKTFASLAEEKFTTYMNMAEDFVRNGQFYKAADTYALANVWKPKDARGYLGQSFSLLAAGEYMSSAFYLNRAMDLDSKIALKKYDLSAFIGDRDIFENRVLEISTWQQRSGSGEMAFLLAYISYQDDKAVRAKESINIAKTAMPDSKAVMILKNIIDPAEEVLK